MPDPDRPVTLIASRAVCRNAVFTVFLDHVRDAAGNEVTDYLRVVPHHRAQGGVTGVAVLPVVDGRLGLVRVFRYAIGDFSWETVRGFVDAGETPAAAAARELLEEAGLETDAGALRDLGTVAPEPGLLDARVRLFVAEDCRRAAGATGAEFAHREFRFFGRDEWLGMIDRGEILDPSTLVCTYRHFGIAK